MVRRIPKLAPTAPLLMLALMLTLSACQRPAPKPPKPAKVPVTSEIVKQGPFQAGVSLLGRVAPNRRIQIRPPAAGRIHYGPAVIGGFRAGQTVERGQLLFSIESPGSDLALAEAELAAQAADTELSRAQKGVEAGILPQAELEARQIDAKLAARRLAKAKVENERLTVRAPASGSLKVERAIVAGTEVGPDTLLAELAGDGAVRVEAWIPAGELDRLAHGLAVECRLPNFDGIVGMGKLAELAQEVEDGGVARAVVDVVEDHGMPRFGEGIELRVLLPEVSSAVTVPSRAVIRNGHVTSVFVLEKVGKSLRAGVRLVQIGGEDGECVEVLDGLQAGDRIAVEGAEYLADGLPAEDVAQAAKKKKGRR